MDLESLVKFKGYSYRFNGEIDFWGTTVDGFEAVLEEEVDFDTEGADILESIRQKIVMLQALSLDSIKEVIEKATDKKIRKVKPANVSFDFVEHQNEECGVDVYFDCGKVLGGFAAHIRITDNGNKIEMAGIS